MLEPDYWKLNGCESSLVASDVLLDSILTRWSFSPLISTLVSVIWLKIALDRFRYLVTSIAISGKQTDSGSANGSYCVI